VLSPGRRGSAESRGSGRPFHRSLLARTWRAGATDPDFTVYQARIEHWLDRLNMSGSRYNSTQMLEGAVHGIMRVRVAAGFKKTEYSWQGTSRIPGQGRMRNGNNSA